MDSYCGTGATHSPPARASLFHVLSLPTGKHCALDIFKRNFASITGPNAEIQDFLDAEEEN